MKKSSFNVAAVCAALAAVAIAVTPVFARRYDDYGSSGSSVARPALLGTAVGGIAGGARGAGIGLGTGLAVGALRRGRERRQDRRDYRNNRRSARHGRR